MKARLASVGSLIFPPIPEDIREDFALLRASRIQSHTPLLFLTLGLTTPTAAFAASSSASFVVRVVLPLVLGLACFLGYFTQMKQRHMRISPRRAARMISESTWVSGSGAVLCSTWCVLSWLNAPHETRIYYPMIMSMGSLATAFCLSTMRWATIVNLGIGLLPISILMLLSGDRMDVAAGTSLFVATAFLLRMIFAQHSQLVALLILQRQMRELATTDPLTGLFNRRAWGERLDQEIAAAGEGDMFPVVLLDLDGFKPVNDQYGHATGDMLLCEVANRLVGAAGDQAVVARLGGDEFAVLMPKGSVTAQGAGANIFLTALLPVFSLSGHQIRIGASIGVAHWPADGRTPAALFETADRALYAVKALATKPDRVRARLSR